MIGEKHFGAYETARQLFRGYGSFGLVDGRLEKKDGQLVLEAPDYCLTSDIRKDESGVFVRRDTFCNTSSQEQSVNCLHSRFLFHGGEYEVYTQFDAWQTESLGGWQELVTSVRAAGPSTRTAQHAAPFMVLWSKQENRGVAFHLLPNCAWEMNVTRAATRGKYTSVVVDLGILESDLNLKLAPGEAFALPTILCYEVQDRVSLDCWKLHAYMNKHYPRREMPIIYNSWLYRFTSFDYALMKTQLAPAAALGAEYFVMDAGWFGDGRVWVECTGDWKENTKGNFAGHMAAFAEDVRAAGMKFGLWLEPERAGPETDAIYSHKEYYVKGDNGKFWFLDFSNEKARQWMLEVIAGLVGRYGVAFIKDDYNADLYYDIHHCAFLKYHQGHELFIQALREKYPDLYLSSCGSGGGRMELTQHIKFDSTWPTDNCSPYRGLRIYKDTLLRLPPQGFEKVLTLHSLVGYEEFYEPFGKETGADTERAVACGDAIWKHIEGIRPSFLKSYMTGGPVTISCDLTKLSKGLFEVLQKRIAEIKENRSFWMNAQARILCDTPTAVALQYNNAELSEIVVQLFTLEAQQSEFVIRPCVDPAKDYWIDKAEKISGKQILEEGLLIRPTPAVDNWREAVELKLTQVQ